MLGNAQTISFIAATDAARALAFYRDTLGLKLVEESPFALVFEAGAGTLRVQLVEAVHPHPYTAAGWAVLDIHAAFRQLVAAGVPPVRFDFMEQDSDGIWVTPDGAKVLWFRDPDDNLLSLTEFPSA